MTNFNYISQKNGFKTRMAISIASETKLIAVIGAKGAIHSIEVPNMNN